MHSYFLLYIFLGKFTILMNGNIIDETPCRRGTPSQRDKSLTMRAGPPPNRINKTKLKQHIKLKQGKLKQTGNKMKLKTDWLTKTEEKQN